MSKKNKMTILVTGATGLVGKKLVLRLFKQGNITIRLLTRNKERAKDTFGFPVESFEWDPIKGYIEKNALAGVDGIIHLAGESVAEGRWTKKKKQKIIDSRILSTQLLTRELANHPHTCQKFICASAVGYYGDTQDTKLSEESDHGDDFLAKVCYQWEQAALTAQKNVKQVICLRIGVVLSAEGGALQKMLPVFQAGLAGKLGTGRQYMSWVHIDDLIEQFNFLVHNKECHGAFNGTAPNPVANSEFTATLCKNLNRPGIFMAPAPLLKLVLGEQSIILLGGQRALPRKFKAAGFKFKFLHLNDALADLLKFKTKGEEFFTRSIWLNKSPAETFHFFSDEKNLEKITPPHLNFKVVGMSTPHIQAGSLIDYKLRLHGIPFKWQSLIKAYAKNKMFIDEQVRGPYSKWHHTHSFQLIHSGTLMTDEIIYKVPMGLLGRILAGAYIKNDVKKIFNFRNKVIQELIQ